MGTLYKDLASDPDDWFPIPITTFVFYAFNFASLFTLLVALVADYRMTPEGVECQQYKPVAFGTGAWIVFFALGPTINALLPPLYPTEARRAWISMIEWACYSIAWMGLPVGLLVGSVVVPSALLKTNRSSTSRRMVASSRRSSAAMYSSSTAATACSSAR